MEGLISRIYCNFLKKSANLALKVFFSVYIYIISHLKCSGGQPETQGLMALLVKLGNPSVNRVPDSTLHNFLNYITVVSVYILNC